MDPRYNTYSVDKSGAIVDGFGATLYDDECLEDMSDEARQRLANLHTEHPDWDWLTASSVLVEEGLIEPF
jgi:hypothetical protein